MQEGRTNYQYFFLSLEICQNLLDEKIFYFFSHKQGEMSWHTCMNVHPTFSAKLLDLDPFWGWWSTFMHVCLIDL